MENLEIKQNGKHTQHELFQTFLNMSVVLTGFKKYRLLGTGQAELYFEKIEKIVGVKTMSDLLTTFNKVAACNDEVKMNDGLRAEILSDPKFGPIARNIILVWYVGTWYQLPNDWCEAYGQSPLDETFVMSPLAYTEGLLWPAVGAHPPGAKAPGWDSWGNEPVFE
jgi:hypothetical protein